MMLEFYRDKRVFVTGHTGFKGSWLCQVLKFLGAHVTGYALEAEIEGLFALAGMSEGMTSVEGDVRNIERLSVSLRKAMPDIVIHMAAQPLVLDSYERPVYTFGTNVMGTVNLLECVRTIGGVKSVVNVTTDKVYLNNEWPYAYRETDSLGGHDPYSASKACSELVTKCFRSAFFQTDEVAVSTVRAGNVIGGGDISANRIIPDCVRAAAKRLPIEVRNPSAIRPYQHVLESLFAYLLIAKRQYENPAFQGEYNIGPADSDCVTTGELVTLFCDEWGEGLSWKASLPSASKHESSLLRLDSSKAASVFGWHSKWGIRKAVTKTVELDKVKMNGGDITAVMRRQIGEFCET